MVRRLYLTFYWPSPHHSRSSFPPITMCPSNVQQCVVLIINSDNFLLSTYILACIKGIIFVLLTNHYFLCVSLSSSGLETVFTVSAPSLVKFYFMWLGIFSCTTNFFVLTAMCSDFRKAVRDLYRLSEWCPLCKPRPVDRARYGYSSDVNIITIPQNDLDRC